VRCANETAAQATRVAILDLPTRTAILGSRPLGSTHLS
jgi:hypothetical protein